MSYFEKVTFLNPLTCGIYKDGQARYKTNSATGKRTTDIDNELIEQVDAYLNGTTPRGIADVPLHEVFERQILVPTYFDDWYNEDIRQFLDANEVEGITLGNLLMGERSYSDEDMAVHRMINAQDRFRISKCQTFEHSVSIPTPQTLFRSQSQIVIGEARAVGLRHGIWSPQTEPVVILVNLQFCCRGRRKLY